MYPHNREGTSTKICNHAKKCKYSLCNKAKQMAPTIDFTVILKIFQYLNIPSVQHLLPCHVLKCSHDMKFLVPFLTSFLHSQNNLATDKVLNKMGLKLGSVRSLLQLSGWKSTCSPPAPLTVCVLKVCLPEQPPPRPSPGHNGHYGGLPG